VQQLDQVLGEVLATAGYNYDVLKKAVVPQLEKDGYTVKLIEFNDYIQPNLALAEGSLDANLFQHITYLKRFAEDRKLDLVAPVPRPPAPPGAYPQSGWASFPMSRKGTA